MERERNTRTGETGGITIFFYSREIFGSIFLSLKVSRDDEYYSVIVTARYGLLYLPRKNLFSLENMHTYMMGILGNMIFRGLKKRKKKKSTFVRSSF